MRILIADDSGIVRRGVAALLTRVRDWSVCGEARSGEEAPQKARDRPDLIFLDVSLPSKGFARNPTNCLQRSSSRGNTQTASHEFFGDFRKDVGPIADPPSTRCPR